MEHERLMKFIEKAREIHGNKYDYSKSDAPTCKDKAIFICPIHGEFEQTWDNHINGKSGCPKCAKSHKYTNEEWIEEVSKKHNNKYDYSKTHYTKAKDKVIVICHEKDEFGDEHGEFEIRAGNHMAGIGCPKCAKKYRPTTEEWIKRAKKVHGDKYIYDRVKYINQNCSVEIICPIHGNFKQMAALHIQGCGCPKCNGGVKITKDDFIEKAQKIHGDKYDYTKFNYINAKTEGLIICPIHGDFLQTPDAHLRGQGCPKCKSSKLENILMKFFEKNNINYTYQYKLKDDKVLFCDFLLNEYNIIVECQGEQHFIPTSFDKDKNKEKCEETYEKVVRYDILKYNMCINNGLDIIYFTIPEYFNSTDVNINTEFYKDKILITDVEKLLEYIKTKQKTVNADSFLDFYEDVRKNISKNIINANNIIKYKDYVVIYVPLIPNKRNELNDKRRMYAKRGYKVIIVFEDEYINNREIVLSKIRHLFKLDKLPRIMARKCTIKEIRNDAAETFLNKNHIQGFVNSSIYLGAYYNNDLVAVMSFLKENNNNWNLTRFASDNRRICCGIGGKLFKYFIRNYDFNTIKSFADKRWTYDMKKNIYLDLGFKQEKNMMPEYRYFKPEEKVRHHKFGFRKQILHKKYNLPLTMTETEMTKELGYDRIWDCGLIKYVYTNSDYIEN